MTPKPKKQRQMEVIWNEIRQRRGKRKAVHAEELAKLIGIDVEHDRRNSWGEIRRIVGDTMVWKRVPIGGDTGVGYWLIASDKELKEVISSLEHRVLSIESRIKRIHEFYQEHYNRYFGEDADGL